MKCAICGYRRKQDSDMRCYSLFRFPKHWNMQKIWISMIKKNTGRCAKPPVERVCERHFREEDIDRSESIPKLHRKAVPSLFKKFNELQEITEEYKIPEENSENSKKTKPLSRIQSEMPRLKNINREKLNPDGVGARVGSRLKKAKVVFDPSLNNLPKKATRSLSLSGESSKYKSNNFTESLKKPEKEISSSPPNLDSYNMANDCCMICDKSEMKKGRKLIACKDCNYKVHSTCLKITFINEALLEEHWRCDNCRMCVVCYETSEVGPLISCCICVDAYHLNCHTPKLYKNINKFKWECSKCQNIDKNTTSRKLTAETKKRLSPTPSEICIGKKIAKEGREKVESNLTKITTKPLVKRDEISPDISDWTSEKVSKYFELEFPNEASKFKEHDIDGASLLLVKRSDIVNGLSLKLGPAIRLYTRIVQLQTKSNDPRLTWM